MFDVEIINPLREIEAILGRLRHGPRTSLN